MAAAQEARQKAIEDREAAIKREVEAQKARARARRIIAWGSAVAAGLLILGVAWIAYEQTVNFRKQQELTEEARRQAERAEANLRRGQIAESYFRAEQAKAAGADTVMAAMLALEGLNDETSDDELQRTRPFVSEPWFELYSARLRPGERKVLAGHAASVLRAVFSPPTAAAS
jgi:flagellar biosynthesis/type III secretory pathway M-ring protein FliF/YscJ